MSPEFRVYIPQEVSAEFVEGIKILRGEIREIAPDNEHDSFIEKVRETLSLLPEDTKLKSLGNPRYNANVPEPWKLLYGTLNEPQRRQLTRTVNFLSWNHDMRDPVLADRKKFGQMTSDNSATYAGVKTLDLVRRIFVE